MERMVAYTARGALVDSGKSSDGERLALAPPTKIKTAGMGTTFPLVSSTSDIRLILTCDYVSHVEFILHVGMET
jgi:hypothetical protein